MAVHDLIFVDDGIHGNDIHGSLPMINPKIYKRHAYVVWAPWICSKVLIKKLPLLVRFFQKAHGQSCSTVPNHRRTRWLKSQQKTKQSNTLMWSNVTEKEGEKKLFSNEIILSAYILGEALAIHCLPFLSFGSHLFYLRLSCPIQTCHLQKFSSGYVGYTICVCDTSREVVG